MGRSVSVPSGAVATVYLDGLDIEDELFWEDFVDSVQFTVSRRYPSFETADHWVDDEEKAILENEHAIVVLAEYCGCVSVSLVPKDQGDGLWGDHAASAEAWCRQVADNWRQALQEAFPERAMVRIGGMSNGVSVYRKVAAATV